MVGGRRWNDHRLPNEVGGGVGSGGRAVAGVIERR